LEYIEICNPEANYTFSAEEGGNVTLHLTMHGSVFEALMENPAQCVLNISNNEAELQAAYAEFLVNQASPSTCPLLS
jgi:hypothetical protein